MSHAGAADLKFGLREQQIQIQELQIEKQH